MIVMRLKTKYSFPQIIAKKMGLNTNTNFSLWRDKAVIEANLAVLYSYQVNELMQFYFIHDSFY